MSAYHFGENWKNFVDHHLSDEQIDIAVNSLKKFLRVEDLKGKSFLDIGCGSGLFSYAAYELGASKIISVDVDNDSVECTEYMKEKKSSNVEHWQVSKASILDLNDMKDIGKCDVVYSWGVLHHTGNMQLALENAFSFVKEEGLIYIAIYNTADEVFALYPDGRVGNSNFWTREKKFYVSSPRWLQSMVDTCAASLAILGYLLKFKNPVKEIKAHHQRRGMDWLTDIRDWLGGWPYETAKVHEIFEFARDKGFVLENLKNHNGLLCNEYLFRKK